MDIHSVVYHVGLAEKLDFGLEDLTIIVELPVLEEFEHRKDQVAVQVRRDARREIVGCHWRAEERAR